jgi:hypothetical protein
MVYLEEKALIDWLEYKNTTIRHHQQHSRLNIFNIFFTDTARVFQYDNLWREHVKVFRFVYNEGLDALDNLNE